MPRNSLSLVTNSLVVLAVFIACLGLSAPFFNFSVFRIFWTPNHLKASLSFYSELLILAGFLLLTLHTAGWEAKREKLFRLARLLLPLPLVFAGYLLFSGLMSLRMSLPDMGMAALWVAFAPIYMVVLCAALIMVFLMRQHQLLMVYGVGVPSLWILNASIFCLAGHWRNIPMLENLTISPFISVAFMLISLAILMGTIPVDGLLVPLASENRRVRIMAVASLIAGYSILIFNIANLSAAVGFIDFSHPGERLSRLIFSAELTSVLVSVLVTTLGLRAAFFYSEASSFAQQQRSLAERQIQFLKINQAIHSTLNLEEIFEIIAGGLGSLVQADRCVICRYNAQTHRLFPPTREYLARENIPSMLKPGTNFSADNGWLALRLEQEGQMLLLDSSAAEDDLQLKRYLECLEIRSGAACPVLYDGQMIALLMVHQLEENTLDAERLDIIKNVAIQAAITVHQAELFEEKSTAEQMLSHQLNFTKALTASLGEGVIATDAKGQILFINPAACEMLGWQASDLMHRSFYEWVHPTILQLKSLQRENRTENIEDTFTRKDGSTFPVSCTYSPMQPEHQPDGVIFAFHDMTERKRAEKELESYASRLEQSNRELEQFAYLASHDLQAPLIKLQKFSEMLKKIEPLDSEGLDIVSRIESAAHKMQTLIQDVLALARVTTTARPFEQVNLDRVVQEVLNDFEEPIHRLNAHIEVGTLGEIEADFAQIRQMVQNLLDNSLKFHRSGIPPEIQISVKHPANNICQLIVRDNGIGFKNEYRERIFNMFERLHGLSTYEGNGIGLAICKKTVERHHGTLEAFGEPDKGATFIASFPCRQSE
jgi:PAS domain S-box-containing protein